MSKLYDLLVYNMVHSEQNESNSGISFLLNFVSCPDLAYMFFIYSVIAISVYVILYL